MPAILPHRFEIDYTGENENNYILGEVHQLKSRKYRPIAPVSGAFYVDNLQVFDTLNNRLLTKGIDYKCLNIVSVVTAITGKEVCTIVLITNSQVSSSVHVNIHYVGGEYEKNAGSLQSLIENLMQDDRPVLYADIENKPTNFEPSPHFVNVSSTIGYEYLVYEMEKIRQAILMGDALGHQQLEDFIKQCLDLTRASIRQMNLDLFQRALIIAQTSVSSSTATALLTGEQNERINTALSDLQLSLRIAQQHVNDNATSEALARDLMASYPTYNAQAIAASMVSAPSGSAISNLNFPLTDAQGVYSESSWYVKENGDTVYGTPSSDSVFVARMKLIKEINTSRAVVQLVLTSKAVSTSSFSNNIEFTVLPLQIGISEKPLELVVFDSSYLVSLAADSSVPKYALSHQSPIANKNMPVDDAGISTMARSIASCLMDFRRDFNVLGYGSSDKRAGVHFSMKKGAEISFTFKLSGVRIEDIKTFFNQGILLKLKIEDAAGVVIKTIDKPNSIHYLSSSFA